MRTAVALLAMALTAGCDPPPPEPPVTVDHAVVMLPAVPGRPGAAYFTLRTSNGPTRLIGVGSPRIGRIELHESVDHGSVSRMVPLRNGTFSSGAPLAFVPGGGHAMLFDIDPTLRPGDHVDLTFSLQPAPPVTVPAEVRAAGDHAMH